MAIRKIEENDQPTYDLREIKRKGKTASIHIHNTTEEIVISVDDVIVDEAYQRAFKPKRAKEIAADFDPELFDKPLIAPPIGGKYPVIDGQTRIGALRLRWPGQRVTFIADLAGNATTTAAQAKRFNGRNTYVSKSGAGDKLRALIAEGKGDALAFQEIVDRNGFRIKWGGGRTRPGQIGAYVFDSVRKYCGASWQQDLDDALTSIRQAWGVNGYPMVSAFVTGVALIFKRYRDEPTFDRRRFVDKMASKSAPALSSKGKDKANDVPTRHEYGCRIVLRNLYNSGATVNVLPEF